MENEFDNVQPNIVQYFGLHRSADDKKLYIVTELMENGSLLGLLQKNALTERQLLSMYDYFLV